ncbi:MAG: TatD family hydrolase [Acidobacteria bacterium]|nr:TatD family hydrolase [Acidobacteriota bacterium]
MTDNDIFWIDSHAHLTMVEPGEVEATIRRAREAGVGGVVTPATNPADLERTLHLGRDFPSRVKIAVGLHPHDASCLDASFRKRLEEAAGRPGVVAIGEIGLDYHYMNSPREDQLDALEWQLDLATETGLPVIIHNRDSWHDLAPVLERREGSLSGVCHSFTEPPVVVKQVLALGLYVGVSGMVTFRQADNIREMVGAIDLDRLLVETDSPFLAPVPHRGRPNEPAYVPLVGAAVAQVLGKDIEEVARRTTANVERLFGCGFGRGAGGASES